ncbi:MAG TPA: choice-of-anchor Q domain-containing protein, partial [Myxococcota bacterium]|nr:choice-of-anchor Q domain-containing protein [Myxococcota bacterium]
TEGIQATTTGLWIVDADVRVVGSRVGSGSPRPVEYAGTGTVERIGVGTGILLQSGTLRMNGGVLGFGADVELYDILGTAIARAEVRGLKAAGGRAMLAGVDVSGSAEAGTDDTGADQGMARGVAEVDIAAIEVSGGAHVQVVNALVTVPRANATADVYVEGAGPADAVYEARVATAAVRVSDGIVDLLHCVLYSDRFTEALGDSYTPAGTATGTAKTTVRLIEVGAGGQARVVNTSGISQVSLDDSALVQVGGGGRLRLVHDVLWDDEYGVCSVHDGTACAVDDTGDLDDCAAASGCVAVQAQVADPKYKWWDGVNAGSPLQDGGVDPATEGLGAFTDRAGNPRPNGDGWDIGAYEF